VDDVEKTAGEAVGAIFGTGRQSGDEMSAEKQTQSFLMGVMASLLAVTARKELGSAVPVINIETGDSAASSKVRAGFELEALIPKFLEDIVHDVYVEGIVAGDEEQEGVQWGVLLELFFPRGFVGASQYGPGETWSIDVFWEPR
jgi:hypothetical protein